MDERHLRRSHRSTATAVLGAVLLSVWALVAPGAGAQEADGLTIRTVDVTAYPDVRVEVVASSDVPPPGTWTVLENNVEIDVDVVPGGATTTVLVIDVSDTMESSGSLAGVQQSALDWVSSLQEGERLALVTAGNTVRVVTGPTADTAALTSAVAGVEPETSDSLAEGVLAAADLLDGVDGRTAVVVATDGIAETQSVTPLVSARQAVLDTGAELFLAPMPFGPGSGWDELAGGPFAPVTSITDQPDDVAEVSATEADLQLRMVREELGSVVALRWTSASSVPQLDVVVSVGPYRSLASVETGVAPSLPEPVDVATPSGLPFLDGSTGKFVIVGLVLVAALVFALALLMIFTRRDDIANRLSVYTDEAARLAAADAGNQGGLAASSMMRKAVKLTEGFAIRAGLLDKIGVKLDQANLPLRPAEGLLFWILGTALLGAFGVLLAGGPVGGAVFVAFGAVFPLLFLKFMRRRRLSRFLSQLPETLTLLSSTLRAGYSLTQGVETVAQETRDPMGRELQRVIVEHRLGRPLEEALDEMALRMESKDFEWAVMAIRIQREVGGNLAELLQTVSETMVLRERMRREVKALTAEGQISALVLGLLPVALGGIMYLVAPDYIGKLFTETTGLVLTITSGVSMLIGLAWLKKLITIDV